MQVQLSQLGPDFLKYRILSNWLAVSEILKQPVFWVWFVLKKMPKSVTHLT